MPLTQAQVLQIKQAGKAKGYSDKQINSAILEMTKQYESNGASSSVASVGTAASGGTVDNAITNKKVASGELPASQAEIYPQGSAPNQSVEKMTPSSFVGGFFKSLYTTGSNYTKFVAEAAAQGVRSVIDPTIGMVDQVDPQVTKLTEQSRSLIQQAKQTQDPKEKERLLNESRAIDTKIEELGSIAGSVAEKRKSFFVDENKISDQEQIVKTGAKATAGAASLAIPGGQGVKAGIALGATAGALYGFSEGEDIDVDKIITGAVTGGVVGGAIPAVGNLLGKGKNLVTGAFKKIGKFSNDVDLNGKLSNEAAERITKATPSAWQKAVDDHGIDLNALTKKFVLKAKDAAQKTAKNAGDDVVKNGIGYDDLLGPISERGRGGILKTEMELSEKAIADAMKNVNKNTKFTIDEVTDALTKEKKLLAKLPGNENNIAALEEFIKGFKAQYGKGITPKRALELKRIADSQFGKAVADETTGSAVSQAQKMVANAFRAKLKKLMPAVKGALDNETEIYTIQPILGRARATLNTQGSKIRVGSNVTQGGLLAMPANLFDWYLANPKRASKFITPEVKQEVATKVGKEVGKLTGQDIWEYVAKNVNPGYVAQNAAIRNSSSEMNVEQVQSQQGAAGQVKSNINGDGSQNKINQDNAPKSNLAQKEQQEKASKPFGGRTKNELLQMALAEGASLKDLKEIGSIYDLVAPESSSDVSSLIADREKLSKAGFDTTKIDAQLADLGVTKAAEGPKDLISQINSIDTAGERNKARATKDILDVVNTAIKTSESGVSTGPVSALIAQASKLTGPNKTAQLEKDLKEILRTIRKESTGVAYSDQEITDLEKEIPTIVQQEGNVEDSLIRLRLRMLQKLENYGIDTTAEQKG